MVLQTTSNHERALTLATNVVPSDDFGPDQRMALALAGTVRIPQPVPASGKLYLILNSDANPAFPSGSPRFLLKHVQTVSGKQAVTRFVGLDELRAVEVPEERERGSARESCVVLTVDQDKVATAIQSVRNDLEDTARKSAGVYEEIMFRDAAIYVRETADVLVRIVYEFGVTAAEAVSHVEMINHHTMRCC